MASAAYALDELGWLQFQELCGALLEVEAGVAAGDWSGTADVRREVIVPAGALGVPGPALASVAWLRPAQTLELPRPSFTRCLDQVRAALAETGARSLVLFTNADEELTHADVLHAVFGHLLDSRRVAVIGPGELSARLDAQPALRRRQPATLGVTDSARFVAGDVAAASTVDLAAATELARVFVSTRAYAAALRALEHYGFVVLTGPPEVGKTAIARMVSLAQMTDGWEAHDCKDPDDALGRYRADRAQVFVADDAFGSTEYRPDAAERWARELDRVLARMDARHWLVWTSRPAPLAAGLRRVHRERGLERFPDPGAVQVDAGRLSVPEKALILFRHARAAALPKDMRRAIQASGERIVAHEYFTPERIRRFVGRLPETEPALIESATDRELRTPTDAMVASLDALEDEHRDLLVALLDAPSSWSSERELTHALRRHHEGGLHRSPHELIDRLADHFLRVSDGGVGWVHPSWRDLVIGHLARDGTRRRAFLSATGVHGAALAVSTGGGAVGDRHLPLLRADADWDVLAGRMGELVHELAVEELTWLLHALGQAVAYVPDPWQAGEARALLGTALGAATGRFGQRPVPVGLIEAWLDAAAALPGDSRPPTALGATWIELLPASPPDDCSAAAIGAIDDWSRLVAALARGWPEALAGLGFPNAYEDLLRELVRLALLSDDADLPRAVCRIADASPAAGKLIPLLWKVDPVAEPEPLLEPDWTALDTPPRAGDFSVASVLRDLG